ncbi:hypothetical protein Tco_0601426 [Tanacetum coccineum]
MPCPCDPRGIGIAENMMSKIDIDSLTIEQYLMLIEGSQASGMVKPKFRRTIKKNIEEMTIAEYMEYEAEMERKALKNTGSIPSMVNHRCSLTLNIFNPIPKIDMNPWMMTKLVSEDESEISEHGMSDNIDNDKPLTPKPQHEELSPEEDLDEWLKTEMEKHMVRQDKESEEDALIDILKFLVEECKAVYKGTSSHGTNEIQGGSIVIVKEEWDISETLWLIFEHLKLTDLKETDMTIVMADMTEKTPLGITENVQISLGIGEDRVLFDMNGNVCQSSVPVEKVYVTNFILNEEPFIPIEIREDLFSYESPLCLQFEQRSRFCVDESIDIVDSNDEMHEPEDGHKKVKNFEKITSRWHVCKPVRVFYEHECEKDCGMWPTCNPDLSFCSGYDAIYVKGKNGILKQWMCFRDHERQSIEGNRMTFADFLKVRYGSKSIDDMARERRYYEWIAQNTEFDDDDIPKKTIKYYNQYSFDVEIECGKIRGDPYSTRFKEYKEEFENKIEQLANEYDLRLDDALPLGRVNGSRFIGMIRKEMNKDGRDIRKTNSQQGIGIRCLLGSLSCGAKQAFDQKTWDLDVESMK